MKKHKKYYFSLKEVIILIVFTSIVMAFGTAVIVEKRYSNSNKDIVVTDENVSNFLEAYQTLTENYYEKVDKAALMDSAISSMLNYLGDPYTTYLNEAETEALINSLKGEYEGIGVQITKADSTISVTEVLPDSPAAEKGIEVGDIIIKVNDEDITTEDIPTIVSKIVNSIDKKVKVTVLRDQKELDFNLTVEIVEIPSITSEIINDTIGYIYIDSFSQNTSKQVREVINSYKNTTVKSLIIDVRNDTGGYLNIAEDMAKVFLEKNDIIYSIQNKNGTTVVKDNTKGSTDYKIVVLINGESASASEVLAAALKDSYGATIVGETSYGKGKIQQTATFDNGSMLKYTTAKWLRPNGECVDGVGIVPDYEVQNTATDDNQLKKAIEIAKK